MRLSAENLTLNSKGAEHGGLRAAPRRLYGDSESASAVVELPVEKSGWLLGDDMML